MRETQVQSLGREDLLEKEMAPHSSTLAWKIPWMEEPGRLQSMGSQRVGHDWVTSLTYLLIWTKWYNFNKRTPSCVINLLRSYLDSEGILRSLKIKPQITLSYLYLSFARLINSEYAVPNTCQWCCWCDINCKILALCASVLKRNTELWRTKKE